MLAPAKCTRCGAALNPGAQWCSLCLTPVAAGQPATSGPTASLAALPPPTTPPVILGAAAAEAKSPTAAAAGLPTQRSGQPHEPGAAADPDAMLAELAASEAYRAPRLASALSSRRNRYLLTGAALAVLLGGFLVASLLLARLAG